MRIGRALKGILAFIGLIVVLVILGSAVIGYFFGTRPGRLGEKLVLEIDFNRGLEESAPSEFLMAVLGRKELTLKDTVFAIETASEDPRVLGLVARVGTRPPGLATVQEIRSAVRSFRARNKTAVAYAETFGGFGPGNSAYYMATAFEPIYLQPSGDLGLTGLMFQSPFIKETLSKLGVSPELDRRGEYKTAVNTFTETQYTEPQRVALNAIMESDFSRMAGGIAEARGFTKDKVRELFDQGPFLSSEALNANLVDGLLYRDEVYDAVRRKTDPSVQFVSVERYWASRRRKRWGREPVVAVIYGLGAIHSGKSGFSSLFGSVSMGSDTVTEAFRQAARDERVKAILFRVDSPGGSYVASDTIRREVVRARKRGKPVVVSMGDVAASGGYFVSVAADKIVAEPSTLTGSIGVFAGKAVTADFWNKLGVTWDEMHTSAHSTLWSSTQPYSSDGWDILQKWLDHIYRDFITKVSEGRGLSAAEVDKSAKGRVWTGEMARDLGLVDDLGGFPEALRIAKDLAQIPAGTETRLEVFPKAETLAEVLFERLLGGDGQEAWTEDPTLEWLASAARTLDDLHRLASAAGWLPTEEALATPEALLPSNR